MDFFLFESSNRQGLVFFATEIRNNVPLLIVHYAQIKHPPNACCVSHNGLEDTDTSTKTEMTAHT